MIPRRVMLCLFLVALTASASLAEQPRYLRLDLLTTNDLHANLLPVNYAPNLKGKVPVVENAGGAARRASVIREIRAEARTPVLLLDSGDTTYGVNPLAKAFHGAPDVEVMNALAYEAMGPGNHDFQWPAADSLRNIRNSRFPWVCANLVDKNTGKLLLEPYVIREIWGVRVAFFGLITQLVNKEVYKAAHELNLESVEPIAVAAKLVPELRAKADIVICLSHLGTVLDRQLAKTAPGIDVILGGHSHTRLPHPEAVQVAEPTAFCLGVVPVVQAFCWGGEIGRTQVIFRRDPATGRYALMSYNGDLISINPSLAEDSEIAAIVGKYQKRMKPAAAAVKQ